MSGTVIFIIILVVLILLFAISGSSKKAGQTQKLKGFEHINNVQMNSATGNSIFQGLKQIYEEGSDEKVMEYKNKINSVTDQHDADYIDALYTELLQRIVNVGGSKGLQLQPNERCLFSDLSCAVYTIQKLNKNIVYGGFRTNINGFRTGMFNVMANDVEGYKIFVQGKVFVTNKRVVVLGTNKNKVIPINKIVSYAIYESNGILINVENSNGIVVDLITNGTFEVASNGERFFHDSKFGFLYALDKAITESRQ